MMDKSVAETIRERIAAVELVAEAIAGQGAAADLHDLRILLINTMSLLKRDPGVEAAVDDLYASAQAIIRDAAAGVHPVVRNVRLLRSALTRFSERVPAASGLVEAEDALRLRGLEAAYAVQLERTSIEDVSDDDVRTAA